jgi:hypothetical protein
MESPVVRLTDYGLVIRDRSVLRGGDYRWMSDINVVSRRIGYYIESASCKVDMRTVTTSRPRRHPHETYRSEIN